MFRAPESLTGIVRLGDNEGMRAEGITRKGQWLILSPGPESTSGRKFK